MKKLILAFLGIPTLVSADGYFDSLINKADLVVTGVVTRQQVLATESDENSRSYSFDLLVLRMSIEVNPKSTNRKLVLPGDTLYNLEYFTEARRSDTLIVCDECYYIIPLQSNNASSSGFSLLDKNYYDGTYYDFYLEKEFSSVSLVLDSSESRKQICKRVIAQDGKWTVIRQYRSDSTLLDVEKKWEEKGMPRVTFTKYAQYDKMGKLVVRTRSKEKIWAIGSKWIEWTFREDGQFKLKRSVAHGNWCN